MNIMLDAGHGYETPGKRSPNGMKEYEFNRAVAAEVQKQLGKYQGVTIYSSHSDKKDVPLKERTDKANRLGVDCFISIHANAFGTGWNNVRGIETYIYVTKPKIAHELAAKIHNELIHVTGFTNRGVKTADFHVLRETKMTAVLVECGFMTNKKEEKLLRSASYQQLCAVAIVKGLQEQYQLKENRGGTSLPLDRRRDDSNSFPGKRLFKVQVGAFCDRKNAEKLAECLEKDGYEVFIKEEKEKN